MLKRNLRIISLCLAIILTVQMSGILEISAQATSTSQDATIATEEEPEIIGEDISKRDEKVKHFRMSDGSFMAVSYGTPVHFKDDSGNWQDINNTPLMATDAEGIETYQISNGDTSINFASTLETGHCLTISVDNKAIEMSLLDTDTSLSKTLTTQTFDKLDTMPGLVYDRNATAELTSVDSGLDADISELDAITPSTLGSSIVYEDVYPGVDIRYTTWSYTIKEEIIVKSVQSTYRYDFFLKLDNLYAVINDNGSISMMDRYEKEVFKIPAPFMFDAAGNYSDLVTYNVTVVDEGIVLTVEADKEWIEAEDRVFPVSIDPSISTSEHAPWHTADDVIYSTYVHPSYPNPNNSIYYGDQRYTGFGTGQTTNPYIIYMYFNLIPEVPVGCIVSDASVRFRHSKYSYSGVNVMPIGMFSVTDPVPEGETPHSWFVNMAYSNKPAYDMNHVIDFVNTSKSTEGTFVTWDITELAKGWYSGQDNRAVALAPMGEYNNGQSAWQYYNMHSAHYCPVMTVTYRSSYGIEDYYTYQSMSVGEAGTAHIADSTGQLKVVKNLLNFNSDANPFSVNLVYNSDYFINSSADYLPPSEVGLNMSIGSGWTLDCIRTVSEEIIGNDYYVKYRDGDGTVHYFTYPYDNAPRMQDEDGLGLYMTHGETEWYRIFDYVDNYMMFTGTVFTEYVDWNRNKIFINYEDKRITSITRVNKGQAEEVLAIFAYDGNLLTSITDTANNVYEFMYTPESAPKKLAAIEKNGTQIAQFDYTGYQLTQMLDSESTYKLNFSYDDADRISGYSEQLGTSTGGSVMVSYPGSNHIQYRDAGADQITNNADDLCYHYLFDHAGRTVNSYVTNVDFENSNHTIYGASNGVYSGSNSTDRKTNRLLRSASTGMVTQQLLHNTSFELGSWTLDGTSVDTTKPRTGTKSLKGTTANAETVQSAQTVSEALIAGETYTFSGFVNTENMTFTGKGIYLQVRYADKKPYTGDPIAYATTNTIDNGWVRLSVTFTAAVSGPHTLEITREGAVGTFYADDFQLETNNAPSSYNMVENGSMISTDSWTITNIDDVFINGALSIAGDPLRTDGMPYQDVAVNLPGTQSYVLAGWAQAETAVPDNVNTAADPAQDTNKQFGLRAQVTYSDGTKEYHYVPFNTDIKTWQFVSYTIVPAHSEKTVATIRITCAYESNIGEASFDNITLVQEVAQSMSYDDSGLLTSVSTTGLSADKTTYYATGLINKIETAGSGTYKYNYGDSKNSYRATSITNGLTTEAYTYNNIGNLTATTLTGTGSKRIITSSTYSADGNLVETVTDAAGSTISYTYGDANSKMLARPTSVTAPNGTVTTTSYDAHNRVVQTNVDGEATLVYNYSNGYLSSIVRTDSNNNTQTYNLINNEYGLTTAIKVGNRILASYQYQGGYGPLLTQTDGNGGTVTYVYDKLGRVQTATYSSGLVLSYTYTGDGNLYSVTATENGNTTKYIYGYDSNDRLIYSERKIDDVTDLRTRQYYDGCSRLSMQVWQIGESIYSESFTYNSDDYTSDSSWDDGALETMVIREGTEGTPFISLAMGYDELRRLSTVTGGVAKKTYTYRDITSSNTTTQVASVTYDLPTDQSYAYTYDSMGNIATYTDVNGTVTYTYDNQGQLLSAVNGTTTYAYTYDTVGNILSGNGHSYTYEDPQGWTDLLTAVDGQSITYDAMGNPTSYYNGNRWTFTWAQGRRLTNASDGTNTISYTYDADGLRTSKTVNGVEHTYYYAGGKLLRESFDSNTLDFFYDSNGNAYALKYNGTLYYYITNLQGDVMSIVDAQGAVVASYNYDPYGNLISDEPAENTVGHLNPLRYRAYYYDSESELYYLQSRYYDPELGRFLNADAFASTGQGILGNNMFAYCLNNPVSFSDPTGALTRGQIHNKVLDQIIADKRQEGRSTLSRRKTCIYYNCVDARGKWGFCDLYDSDTGEVWELKRNTCNEDAAKEQLKGYVNGRLRHKKDLPLSVGGRLIPDGVVRSFTYSDKSGTYDITYWDGGNGILWYDYVYTPSDRQKQVNAAMMVGTTALVCTVVGVLMVYTGGSAAAGGAVVIPYIAAAAEQFSNAA